MAVTWLIIAAGVLQGVALLLLFWDRLMDQLKAQVDASLNVMADAVATLKQQYDLLQQPGVDADAVAATVARLKQGTDTLAAAVASAKAALQ